MIAFLSCAVWWPMTGSAMLIAPAPACQLGQRPAGPPWRVSVPIGNISGRHLRVLRVDGGCSCVRAACDRDVLTPGAVGCIIVELSTLTLPEGPGQWTLHVIIETEGGTAVATDLVLTGVLRRDVTVAPAALAFSQPAGATMMQEIVIHDKRPAPLRITGATSDHPELQVELGPTGSEPTVVGRVRVTAASSSVGRRTAQVTITTDDPVYPRWVIPVVVEAVASGVRATPAELVIPLIDAQTPAVAVVVLRDPAGGAIEIDTATCDAAPVRLRCSRGANTAATVRIEVTAGASGESIIRVNFRRPVGGSVTVPLRWTTP